MNNTKEFFDYLLYIGIVSDDTLELLKSIVEKKTKDNENNNFINKSMFIKSLMGDYLTSLNKDDLFKLGANIYEKYISNKSLTISKHLLKLFGIIENKLFIKVKAFFNFWKNKIINGISPRQRNFQRSKSTEKFFCNNKKNNNINNLNNINNNHLNNINYYINNHLSSENFISRLSEYNFRKENEIKKEKIRSEDDLGNICTFSPNLSLTRKINKKYNEKPKKRLDSIRINELYNDYQKKNENGKLKRNIDKENGFTFSPKLNVKSPYNKNVKENFHERNQNAIKKKKDFVKGFIILRELQMKGVDISKFCVEDN